MQCDDLSVKISSIHMRLSQSIALTILNKEMELTNSVSQITRYFGTQSMILKILERFETTSKSKGKKKFPYPYQNWLFVFICVVWFGN